MARWIAVYMEAHADGDPHFHVALKLEGAQRFLCYKKTLRHRYGLPSHWSCSHTQLWSAVRYGFFPSPKKPHGIDPAPISWTYPDGAPLDLFEESQEPWLAEAWRKRREKTDVAGASGHPPPVFTKHISK